MNLKSRVARLEKLRAPAKGIRVVFMDEPGAAERVDLLREAGQTVVCLSADDRGLL